MKRKTRRLPPLNAVRAFESAARHKSVSRAAEELLVTHGAVSKQVKVLEDYLATRLFERSSTRLALTIAGVELAAALGSIFADLQRAFAGYARPARRPHTCRVSTVPSFASQFLVPRLRQFRDENPDISLQISTTYRLVDLEREPVDFAIRYGTGHWPHVVCEPIGGEALLPVCSPALSHGTESGDPSAVLADAPLIHAHSTTEWSNWLEMAGLAHVDAQSGLIFQDYNVAIKAAIDGQGVCLLPKILILRELAAGILRAISDLELHINRKFYLVYPARIATEDLVVRTMSWLRKETRPESVATPAARPRDACTA
jgi:LysR family glycine cleavage system transcriptional activator